MELVAGLWLVAAAVTLQTEPQVDGLGAVTGEYYLGDGLGLNWTLSLNAAGAFSFEWDGCMGRYDESEGSATLEDGFVRLVPTKAREQGVGKPLPLRWLPVPWGDRMYLLSEDDVPLFASYVNRGWEPRSGAHGLFLLRRDDWQKPAAGPPRLPDRWMPFILTKPVEARVTRVLGRHRAEINAGSQQGVQPGMLLTVIGRKREWADVRATAVAARSSVVEGEYGRPALAKGQRVTSKPH
jgi:hypothetical protein